MIARLRDKALITEVEKGKYLLLGLEPERVLSNPLFIASHLVALAYVSYWSALHFYGLTQQVPLTTFVATTKKKRPVTFRDYAGGLGEIAKALRAALEIVEVDTLVQYANQMGDKSLGSRLGYLLESLDQPVEGLIKSASPVKLDVSGSRSGETDPRWQVIANVPERSLVPQGAG